MEHSLHVHVAAEVLPGPVQITAEGHLTADSCQSLLDVLAPALTLQGCPSITIDLTAVSHVEDGGIQRLEHYISPHQRGRKTPTVHIIGLPAVGEAPDRSPHDFSAEQDPVRKTTVRELMSPLGPTVLASQLLDHAAHEIAVWGEPVVVMSASNQPVGIITEDDLESAAADQDQGWRKISCGRLVETFQNTLRAADPLEDVLGHYQQDHVRPMLVLNGSEAAGILHPRAVFEWCAEHDPNALRTNSDRLIQGNAPITETPSDTNVLTEPRKEDAS